MKQTTAMFTFVKSKELEDSEIYTFVGANTLPDRVPNQAKGGEEVEGEILSKHVLDKISGFINNEAQLGGKYGSYRTISLFHDRVQTGNYKLEEAGFVVPGSAIVKEMNSFPGNFELVVDVEVNKHYEPTLYPDYTPEKIDYKIKKGALGLSIEYNNEPHQERIVEIDGKKYNYVLDTDDFRGFGFARANLIGNPGAVRVKEILIADNLEDNQIYWEGEIDVGGETQKLKIHTHRLNAPDTQFCIHRDRRYNNKALNIDISGDGGVTPNLIGYNSEGQTTKGSSIFVSEPEWQ